MQCLSGNKEFCFCESAVGNICAVIPSRSAVAGKSLRALCYVDAAKAREKQIRQNKHPHHNCAYLTSSWDRFQSEGWGACAFQILTKENVKL